VPELLRGWGRTAPTAATVVAASSLGSVLVDPPARGVLARGLGRSYGDAAQNAGGAVVAMTSEEPTAPILDAAIGIVTAAGATTFDQLLRFLLPRGWFVPVTPGTRHVTIGGAVAADVHGKNHATDGSWMDHVTALDLARPDGDVRTVGPADDAPAFWATGGGMGLTGVVTSCSFRAVPVATSRMLVDTTRLADLDAVLAALATSAARYRVAWLDASARGTALGRGVVTVADHAPRSAVADDDDPLAYRPRAIGAVPPVAFVGRRSIPLLNELRYRANPTRRTGEVHTIASFFHPLDAISGWNRLYGRRGFVQWQCAVPDGAEPALVTILEALGRTGAASHVTVLKRFGPGNAGPLSFPIAGWTLAVDLPAMPSLAPALDALDRVVADAGGRIYLAKDARLDPALVATMYPRLDEWRAVRDRLDPAGVLQSDLGRRLALIGGR
jgi:decaprenylphospho-beta-D-ribofuranose 2-oxidase